MKRVPGKSWNSLCPSSGRDGRVHPTLVRIALVALTLFGSLNGPVSGQDLVPSLYDQGMRLYAQQKYAAAADYLGQVCDMSQDHHQARYYLIYCYLAGKQFSLALKHAEILVARNPGNPGYTQLRDQIRQAAQAEVAAQQKTKTTTRPPKEVISETGDGKYSGYTPKLPSGPSNVKPPPKKPRTLLDEAVSSIDMEEYASAATALDKIIKQEPKNARALHFRGVVEFNQRNWAGARPWLEKAVAAKSDSFESLFLLGDTFLREGKYKEAEGSYQKALAVKEDVFAMMNLAECKRKQGQGAEATEIFKKVLKIDPNIPEAKIPLVEIALDEGKLVEASEMINEVLSVDQANSYARFVKAKILFKNGLFDNAAAELGLVIQAAPDNDDYKMFNAKVLLAGFKTGQALDVASQVLRNRDSYESRTLIAECLIANGLVSDAEEHLNIAEKYRAGPDIPRLKALLARKQGDNEKAREQYQAYLAAAADDVGAYIEFAQFLVEVGDVPLAKETLKTAATRFAGKPAGEQASIKLQALGGEPPEAPPAPAPEPPKKDDGKPAPAPGKVKY